MTRIGASLTAAALLCAGLAAPARADDAIHPAVRDAKADFHDKELSLLYAFNPGAIDFAFLPSVSLGVATDQLFSPKNWYYRATWRMVENRDLGLAIALTGGVLQTRERLAGDVYTDPQWGWQGGFLLTLATQSGLLFRSGFQVYDKAWTLTSGQQFLFTPEIAYRFGLFEVSVVPTWPLSLSLDGLNWVGVRLRF